MKENEKLGISISEVTLIPADNEGKILRLQACVKLNRSMNKKEEELCMDGSFRFPIRLGQLVYEMMTREKGATVTFTNGV